LNIDVDFQFLPYELNPQMADAGEPIATYFSRQMGWDADRLFSYQRSLVATAAKAGVEIDFSKRTHYYPTRNAHLLMHWAHQFNIQTELNEHLIDTYFKDGEDINDFNVLLNVASKIGLDKQATKKAITSAELSQELNEKVSRVKTLNISSIPAFIVNENTLISGSNSVKYFENALLTMINEPIAV